ncbi:MAG: hypothetical protein LBQ50_05260 [Planctomycetaceae bacterium]|nr:hypothetical protein [Planctomycetaceae bacterium]
MSIGLFFALVSVVLSGAMSQVFETLEIPLPKAFCTAIHVLTGIIFTVLSVFHTITNWRLLREYIQKSRGFISSKEAVTAFLLMMIPILIATLLAIFCFG